MNSSLFWCIAGILGGAISSLLISLFFDIKNSKKKHLFYDIKTFCIISNNINQIKGLELKYNSNKINNLFSSTITIKNIGNSIIEKDDFASLHPLSISTKGLFLIKNKKDIKLVSSNKSINIEYSFHIISSNGLCDSITIFFDFITPKDEFSFTVFHTDKINFNGSLKEGQISNTIPMSREALRKNKPL